MTTILRARPVVEAKTERLKQRARALSKAGLKPKMNVLLVGDNPASLIYVGKKEKLCAEVGCDFELTRLPSGVDPKSFLSGVEKMNRDRAVTGCFVQLPVPRQLKEIDVTNIIAPEKDVDGFGQASIVEMYKGKDPLFTPCTPKGILSLFEHYNIDVKGKNVTVIGRSLIVGKPISLLLQNRGATVTMCHSQTKDLAFHTQNADIIVSAAGVPKFLQSKYFREDRSQVVVDVGMCRDEKNSLCGDVDFDQVKEMARAITPVPGGVGPLTVFSLIENLILATENILNSKSLNSKS